MSLFGKSASGAGGSILSGTSAQSTGGLFGSSTAAPASGGLFGTTAPAAATSTPSLFGTTSTAPAATTGGLFGNAAAAAPATTGSLFGAPATSTAAAPATTGSLFGAPATSTAAAPATGGLFGTTTAATAPATGGLFGASTTAAPATTGGLFGATSTAAAPATGGLFGTTSTAPASGGLFGATSTTTTSAAGASLFGTPTTSTATTTLGLGGTQQKLGTTTTGGTTTTSLAIGGEKEAVKDGEIAGAAQIREMLPLIEACLKKNREIIEDVENTTVDNSPLSIDEMIDKTRTWINESRRNIREASDMSTYVASLVTDDKQFLETAKKLQDASTTSNQTTLCNTIKSHLFELTDNYDSQMCQMQRRVEGIHTKFERLLNGESALSIEELVDMFKRCDQSYANAQYHIHETGREIEALKNMLIEQGYTHLRKSYPQYAATTIASSNEGAEFFPSQSSLAVIGSSLRAPPTAATTTGLGLGTTGGLFGSTGTSSLFGSTNTAATSKPLFGSTTTTTGGGSLFGNLNTATSTAPVTSSATPGATSSASLFGSKMAPMSTVTNNSSGLLFSMKK